MLARREDLGADEAARALAHHRGIVSGLRRRGKSSSARAGERTFAEFIANVPAAALLESGLKRHYKEPEALHSLRLLNTKAAADAFAVESVKF